MIWILLAALGVPIWLVLGGITWALWNRRIFRRRPGVFACKVRRVSAADASGGWQRGTSYAYWVHDVMLVHHGLALVRFEALPVRIVEQRITSARGVKVKGDDAVSIGLTLDDGSLVEIASSSSSLPLLPGPFPAAWAQPVNR